MQQAVAILSTAPTFAMTSLHWQEALPSALTIMLRLASNAAFTASGACSSGGVCWASPLRVWRC
jgi:hypothetical protein